MSTPPTFQNLNLTDEELDERVRQEVGRLTVDEMEALIRRELTRRRSVAIARTGTRHSEETKRKMSEAAKRRWADPEFRAKTSAAIRRGRRRQLARQKERGEE